MSTATMTSEERQQRARRKLRVLLDDGLTQQQLAHVLRCSQTHVSLFLHGKRNVSARIQTQLDKLVPNGE